jgi:hypothetical protein
MELSYFALAMCCALGMAACVAATAIDPKDWGEVCRWLTAVFARRVGKEDAADLVQEAIMLSVPGGARAFDPSSEVTLAVHVGRVAKDLRRKHARRVSARPTVSDTECDELLDGLPNPEELFLFHERRSRLSSALRREFRESPHAGPVLEIMLAGEMELDVQMRETKLSKDQVVNARRRIFVFLQTWLDREERGMRPNREEAVA